jgi:PAS domain S-box-containing protein
MHDSPVTPLRAERSRLNEVDSPESDSPGDAYEALRRSEERFRLLVQGITDYAIYMLDPEGHVSSWNAGAERFKGYTEREIIGEHFSRFYSEEDRAAGVPYRALETAREEGRFEAEGWRIRKDGTRFWASVMIDALRAPDGNLIGFAKITRDLTERKLAQEQFFQSQKMEAIGKLTGGVAHDFNNILAAITGSIALARKRARSGEDISQFLDNALQAAERGANLTQRMLAFARKQELTLQPVSVIECVRDMATILSRTIGPSISISTQFPLTLPLVMADRAQLELAIMNLMVNARDAMPEGGEIVLTARLDHRRPPQGEAVPMVCLVVRDHGEGMDAETRSRAAEPFFTTKGVGKGTGLGLSMVQGMVEQCGGRLEIDSAPGKGTSVSICLPVAAPRATTTAEPAAAPDEAPSASPARLCILAVDDDPIILLNTASILADLGHEVIEADSGTAALTAIRDRAIDLVISDFAMPGMTGAQLIAAIRRLQPGVRAVVATGFADLPEGMELDAPRLTKPYTEAQLAASIRDAMRDRQPV